jgi:nucleoside-diphosphate-sugar epimerase
MSEQKRMKAFVTGGTGFIGQTVVRQLIERGYQVTALARSESGGAALRRLGAQVVSGDITNRESMREGMRGSDVVFHIAAVYDFSPAGMAQCSHVNVGGTRNVLGLAHELGVPRIVYTSSLAVFGDTHGELPDETYYTAGPFLNEYDHSKWQAHYEVARPLIAQGAPIIIVMPGVVYGPGDNSWLLEFMRMFYRGRLPLLPGPESILTYTYVEDVAEGHILAAEKGRIGESYILAGPAVPTGEMVDFWAQLTGKPRPVVRIPARLARNLAPVAERAQAMLPQSQAMSAELFRTMGVSYAGRADKARTELGWRPRPLQTGMLETFEWIAATEPTEFNGRQRPIAAGILIVAAVLLFLWLLGRRGSGGAREKGSRGEDA